MEIETRVHGMDALVVGLRGVNEDVRQEIRDAVNDSLDAAEAVMQAGVPVGETGMLKATIEKESAVFRPGGLGGGGFHEGELRVGAGIDYMQFVVEGTGVHGPLGTPIQAGAGNVRPKPDSSKYYQRSGAKWMVWTRFGRKWFRRKVKGQPPQDEWIIAAQETANAILAERIARI